MKTILPRLICGSLALASCAIFADAAPATAAAPPPGESGDHDDTIPLGAIPAGILQGFHAAFPSATPRVAEVAHRKGTRIFALTFDDSGTETEVRLTLDGKVVQVSRFLGSDALPQAVVGTVAARYPGGRISKVKRVTAGARTVYKLSVHTTTQEKLRLTVEPGGRIAKTEARRAKGDGADDEE
jgi:hypothetical protein